MVVFGPGFGECILVHVGSNQWIVIDSCTTDSKVPVALEYLAGIGLDPSAAVVMVAVTHWHDDHIRGIEKVVETCPDALVAISQATTIDQFLEYATGLNRNNELAGGNGVREYVKLLRQLQDRKAKCKRGNADRRLMQIHPGDLAHGNACEIWSLAPSDSQIDLVNRQIASLIPEARAPMPRAIANSPNNTSMVLQINVGECGILLGGDLEETSCAFTGWSAIVDSQTRPQQPCDVFKIPHHGSSNGHSDSVWSEMLIDNCIAVVSPFNKGTKLPRQTDIVRISSKTDRGFVTKVMSSSRPRARLKMVEKTIKATGKNLRRIKKDMGFVRLRRDFCSHSDWEILCNGGAAKINTGM